MPSPTHLRPTANAALMWIASVTFLLAAACDAPEATSVQPACNVIALEVGQSRRLAPNEATCIQFTSATGDAEYVAAYLDPRTIDQARSNTADYSVPADLRITVTVGPLSTPSAAPSVRANAMQRVVAEFGPASDAPAVASSYALGDTASFDFDQGLELTKVVAMYGPFVVFLRASEIDQYQAVEANLALAFNHYLDSAESFLAGAFGGDRPTSNASGQFLVFVRLGQGPAGAAYPDRFQMVASTLPFHTWYEDYLLIAHEMTHVKQYQYSKGRSTAWTQWAVEGGASLVEFELARRDVGTGFLSNWDWLQKQSEPANRAYMQKAGFGLGDFAVNYDTQRSVLRDFVQRLVVANVPLEDAYSLVLTASLHGWFGCYGFNNCVAQHGLSGQMGAALGKPFDPVLAMLRVAASIAADDRLTGSEFQNLSFAGLSTTNPVGNVIAMPLIKIATPAVAAPPIEQFVGSLGAVRILDDGKGAKYFAKGSAPLQWLLLRVR